MKISAKDLPGQGAVVERPPCVMDGRNSRLAWERGFSWRCSKETPPEGQRVASISPYNHKGLEECFAIGWANADRIIQALRAQVPA